jgi:hypothetical protein
VLRQAEYGKPLLVDFFISFSFRNLTLQSNLWTSGTVFTTLHFHRNLRISPRVLHNAQLERLANDKHSNSLAQFVCKEEKEVL